MNAVLDWIKEETVATSTVADSYPDITLASWEHPDYNPIFVERARRINAIRTSENPAAVWAALKEFYKTHPDRFITDWGVTYDPRNVDIGLPTLVPFCLFPRQTEFVLWLYDRWRGRDDGLTEKSRDAGVSWLCCGFAVWMWTLYDGASIGFGSRKEEYVDKLGDPKSLLWKVRKFIEFLPVELKPAGWNERTDAPHMRVINRDNGSTIVGEAGDNIGRGNRTSLYFKDESAHYEHADSIDAALSATSNCKIDVSSVNGTGNAFYKKRFGGEIDVFIFDWRQDPRKNQAWYEKECRKLDKVIVAQEIDRNYEASVTNAFIPGDIVQAAMLRGPKDVGARGGLRVGVDPARYGNDRTGIVIRRGRVLLKKITLTKQDTMHVASTVRTELRAYGTKPEQIAVDTIGIGAGVADILRSWYPDVVVDGKTYKTVADVTGNNAVHDGVYFDVTAMMWGEMREWLKTEVSIPNDEEIKSDLTVRRYKFRGGEYVMESKDEMRARQVKSPDIGDALALTFAVPTVAPPPELKAAVLPYRPTDNSMGL